MNFLVILMTMVIGIHGWCQGGDTLMGIENEGSKHRRNVSELSSPSEGSVNGYLLDMNVPVVSLSRPSLAIMNNVTVGSWYFGSPNVVACKDFQLPSTACLTIDSVMIVFANQANIEGKVQGEGALYIVSGSPKDSEKILKQNRTNVVCLGRDVGSAYKETIAPKLATYLLDRTRLLEALKSQIIFKEREHNGPVLTALGQVS